MSDIDKAARRQALEALRDKYRDELEATLKALISIRDDAEAPAPARVNAAKGIVMLMGVPRAAEERAPAGPVAPTSGADSPAPKLDAGVEARIRAVMGK